MGTAGFQDNAIRSDVIIFCAILHVCSQRHGNLAEPTRREILSGINRRKIRSASVESWNFEMKSVDKDASIHR